MMQFKIDENLWIIEETQVRIRGEEA